MRDLPFSLDWKEGLMKTNSLFVVGSKVKGEKKNLEKYFSIDIITFIRPAESASLVFRPLHPSNLSTNPIS